MLKKDSAEHPAFNIVDEDSFAEITVEEQAMKDSRNAERATVGDIDVVRERDL